jgi:hypothetical protein
LGTQTGFEWFLYSGGYFSMPETTENRSMLKILFGIAAAVLAFFLGRKVVREVRKRRAEGR